MSESCAGTRCQPRKEGEMSFGTTFRSWFRGFAPRGVVPAVRRRFTPGVELLENRHLLSSSAPTPIRFDFGTSSSPVAEGATRVLPVAYTSQRGYGWSPAA